MGAILAMPPPNQKKKKSKTEKWQNGYNKAIDGERWGASAIVRSVASFLANLNNDLEQFFQLCELRYI